MSGEGRELCYLEVGNSTFKVVPENEKRLGEVERFTEIGELVRSLRDSTPEWLVVAPVAEERWHAIRPEISEYVLHSNVELLMLDRLMFQEFVEGSYDTPETLGLDRTLNLYGMETDGIVVSCGTAITVDGLVVGKPQWGAIMPGFGTAAKGLVEHAPALPLVDSDDARGIPARTSRMAVANGVFLGTVGAVERIVKELSKSTGIADDASIVLTGGEASILAELWEGSRPYSIINDLQFRGMSRITRELRA